MKNLSVIIAAYNCQEILDRTLFYLQGRSDSVGIEYVVVDDGSGVPIFCSPDIKVIRHKRNIGVGAAFDTGVRAATNERIVLMGADIIVDNSWDSNVHNILEDYPLAITCSTCSGFDKEEQAFMPGRHFRYGAHILRYHELIMPKHIQTDIIQSQWNRIEPAWNNDGMAKVGCVLGAFYVTTRQAFTAIGGFMGHKLWGGLEPMISIRAKRSGYPLYVSQELETAHNFGRNHKTHERASRWDIILYNKMLMAHTMFENPEPLIKLLYTHGPTNWLSVAAKRILNAKDNGSLDDIREFHRQNWINGLIKEGEEL